MKPIILLGAFILSTCAAFAQDTLQYDYAIMNILLDKTKIVIDYSNGETKKFTVEEGADLEKDSYITEADKIAFKGFQLLNNQGFELSGMLFIPNNIVFASNIKQFYFKRARKNNSRRKPDYASIIEN